MFNKIQQIAALLKNRVEKAKSLYRDFRLYDAGSYALNRLTPRRGYSVQHNVAYGLKARHRLDLYASEQEGENPLIVFVHGGAWSHGDKKDYRFVGESFAREGFDVAVINYHLAPQHIFPSSVDDLTLALNYLAQQKQRLKISAQKIVLMGHSAGAFNIMSALYNPKPYELICKTEIRAVIGLAGPYHFDYKGDPLCEDAFDQQVPFQQVMPFYFVESNTVRHYLFTAENDRIVHRSNAVDLDQMLKEKGNHSQILDVPKTGHLTVMGSVSTLFSRYFQTRKMIMGVLTELRQMD